MPDAAAATVTEQGTLPRDKNSSIKSVRANGTWQGSMTTCLQVREFELRTDEPLAVGGTNSAPTPMEFVAAALNGCITVVIETIAAELGVTLSSIETSSVAHMDTRGFHGTADVTPHFVDYALTVQLRSSAMEAEREALQQLAEKRCPALNLIRDAGVALDLRWEWDA